MILGIDPSTYIEQIEIAKSKYFYNGVEVDPFSIFVKNGVSHIRLRIWNNPYNKNKEPYLAGTCDLSQTLKLIEKIKKYNFKYVIDFHYSDFWCDPSKQFLPKEWEGLSLVEVAKKLYLFTKESLKIN